MKIRVFIFSIAKALWILALILNFKSLALGATYYVANTGSDSNLGTISKPYKTITRGVSPLKPGDTLYIRSGTYSQFINLMNKTGTASGWITISGYPGETVIIKPTETRQAVSGAIIARGKRGYFVFRNLIIDGANMANKTGWAIRDGNHNFTLDNITIKNQKTSGLLIMGDNVTVRNSKIHSAVSLCKCSGERWYGIYASHGKNLILENNQIYNNPGGGIQTYPGPWTNVVIRNNSIYGNNFLESATVPGILIQSGDVWATPSIISGVQIYNNLIYKNGISKTGSNYAGGIIVRNYVKNASIANNTVYGNRGPGLQLTNMTYKPTMVTIQNNISYRNYLPGGQIYDLYAVNNGSTSVSNNFISKNPMFMNVSSSDFRLQSSSPAINTGKTISTIKTDIRGVLRPQRSYFDIGAYEM